MTQSNYSVVTNYGRSWNARAAAGESVSPIVEMVFGDGDRLPTGGETDLLNVVHRETISGQGSYEDQSAAWFDAYLEPAIGGFVIREHGLVTADGNLVAIGVRNPGIPKADPATGAVDDFTYRVDLLFDQLEALVVEVDPRHGLTAERRVDTEDGLDGGGALGSNLKLRLDRKRLLRPKVQKFVLTSDWQPKFSDATGAAQQALVEALAESIKVNHSDAAGLFFCGDVGHDADGVQAVSRLLAGIDLEKYVTNGNHDFSADGTLDEFDRHFPARRFHVNIGNVCLICMGDEKIGKGGVIDISTVDWWEEVALAHSDHLVITMTHQPLTGTINAPSTDENNFILNSDDFISRMTRAINPVKIPLWICGHQGSRALEQLNDRTALAHGGCRFLQVGAHGPTILNATPVRPAQYWTLDLTDGSNEFHLRQWSHDDNAYVEANEITVTAPRPLSLRSVPQFDGRYQRSNRFDPTISANIALAAHAAAQNAEQELRIRRLENRPTANMETAL